MATAIHNWKAYYLYASVATIWLLFHFCCFEYVDSLSLQSPKSPLRRIRNDVGGVRSRMRNTRFVGPFHASVPKDVENDEIAQNSEMLSGISNMDSDVESGDAVLSSDPLQPKIGVASISTTTGGSKMKRFLAALPRIGQNDEIDTAIRNTAVPNVINLGVVPLVNSVDTFWVGRLGVALALAGQAAANSASFTLYFLIAFLPTITAPLVASAVASGDNESAQQRVSESLFLCTVLGVIGTASLVAFPRKFLSWLVLPAGAPAMEYAAPYLRWRALGMVPSLIAATGFAAYRGLLDTVTPLKVSLMTNAFNLILDPLCIFPFRLGFIGAAIATAASEIAGGVTYFTLLLKKKLTRWSRLLKPPSWKSLLPILQGGAAMLIRQMALNIGFLTATRRALVMDPSGVSGAAYGIVNQIYVVGVIVLVAMQQSASALVAAALAKSGEDHARKTADRLFVWSTLVGVFLGVAQYLLLPLLVPVFSTIPEVQQAIRSPAIIASLIHFVNGPIFAGEGILMGLNGFKDLAFITTGSIIAMLACLATPLGGRLDGIMISILISNFLQSIGVVAHFLKFGRLAVKKKQGVQRN